MVKHRGNKNFDFNNSKITANQFFSLFFLSRISSVLLFTPVFGFGISPNGRIIAEAGASLITAALFSFLYKASKGIDLGEKKGVNIVFIIYFSLVFLFLGSVFSYFSSAQMLEGDISQSLYIFIVVAAVYGAFTGAQPMARASLILAFFAVLGVLVMLISSVGNFKRYNLSPVFFDGFFPVIKYILFSVFASSEVLCGFFYSGNSENRGKKTAYFWYLLTVLFSFLIPLFSLGLFGDMTASIPFPSFKIASAGNYLLFQRLDAVFAFIWISAFIVKISSVFYCGNFCLTKLFKGKKTQAYTASAVILLTLLSIFFSKELVSLNSDNVFWILGFSFTAAVISAGLLFYKRRRESD